MGQYEKQPTAQDVIDELVLETEVAVDALLHFLDDEIVIRTLAGTIDSAGCLDEWQEFVAANFCGKDDSTPKYWTPEEQEILDTITPPHSMQPDDAR